MSIYEYSIISKLRKILFPTCGKMSSVIALRYLTTLFTVRQTFSAPISPFNSTFSLFRLFTISPFNSTSFTLFLRQFSVARFVVNIDTIIVSTFDRLLLKLALVLEEHFKLRDGNGLNRFQLIPRDTDLPDDSG